MINPKVTIIIPNYNHARFLEERIESVLNQTFQNFEVIILDDCSPDNGASRNIIERYRHNKHISHIIYNDENSGNTFVQWNKGFELARGEYIWLAESDDTCELNLLETLVKGVDTHANCVLAFCALDIINSKGKILYSQKTKKSLYTFFESKKFINDEMYRSNCIWNASSAIFKRKVLQFIPNDYLEYKAAGDYLFWIYIAENGNVIRVNRVMDHCRQSDCRVTDKAHRTGLTFYEDYNVHKYLWDSNLIVSKIRKMLARLYNTSLIRCSSFDDTNTQDELFRIWDPTGFYRSFIGKVMNRALTLTFWRK